MSYITFTGKMSLSNKFVRNRRTPQLISKPTPPGDTIDFGSSMSNAAILPKGNIYLFRYLIHLS